jgi:hypothetical protein
MPVLKNPRHEAFAQAIFSSIVDAKGGAHSQAEAYRRAGYHVTNGNSARACASRLLTFANGIGERIKELQDIAVEHALESANKCVQGLNQLRRDAQVSAVMGKAKLLGLVTERHEDVTKPDFSKATSLQDVGIGLLQAVGYASPSSDDIALALEAHETIIAQLEAIAERAQSLAAEQ